MNIIFFGTPDFSAQVLTYLLDNSLSICAIVTKPDKPKGRSLHLLPSPVKLVAETRKLPLHQPAKASAPDFAEALAAYQPDLFVVVGYGEILKPHLLAMPKRGCINLHVSLLPKYRGAAPIQRCLIAGETESGVTIQHMAEKMDAGDILEVVKVPVGPDTTFGELEQTLAQVGPKALLEVIRRFEHGTPPSQPQDPSQVILAPKIELEECQIDWQKPAPVLHNLVRGVNPHPGAWTWVEVKGKKLRLKINRTRSLNLPRGKPGELLAYGKEGFIVACGEGALQLLEVQLEGKRAMSAEELMRGLPREQLVLSC